jgi:glyoxylase-like metal-dependent hydrolase (beta-lactamase superfamily II)
MICARLPARWIACAISQAGKSTMVSFVREMAFAYGEPDQLSPLVRRVVSRNPGPFTFHGTGVYLVGGADGLAVIDPGPDMPGQMDMLLSAIGPAKVAAILVTHGHLDHSPMARPLASVTGAPIYASATPVSHAALDVVTEEGDDSAFRPDIAVHTGDLIKGPGWKLEAIETPGHAASHVCFALQEENALFSGDHVMGWSTTVVSPPDGDMQAYLDNLEAVRARRFSVLYPTHGPPIRDDPSGFITSLIAHRGAREAQILADLTTNGPSRIPALVARVYAAVSPSLHPAACHSVLAHMIRLHRAGQVQVEGRPDLAGLYRLAP